MVGPDDIPKYHEFMLPVVRAVGALGGSGTTREVRDAVIKRSGASEELIELTYEDGQRSIFVDRIDWGRSYCKMGNLLESPKRGLYLLTPEGQRISELPDAEAQSAIEEVHERVRAERKEASAAKKQKRSASDTQPKRSQPSETAVTVDDPEVGDLDDPDSTWQDGLISRLHRLSPDAFEEFCLYVLRHYGLELTRVGGSGDEGIDGIGTAPLSPVLSARVAVQAKRYDPGNAIGREPVALFQRDAAATGAERAIFITLSRFTQAAKYAAIQSTPTVDLIDGERLCELVVDQQIGITMQPVVNDAWFERFEG